MFNLIDKVKEVNPLVLHYTNEVTINDDNTEAVIYVVNSINKV